MSKEASIREQLAQLHAIRDKLDLFVKSVQGHDLALETHGRALLGETQYAIAECAVPPDPRAIAEADETFQQAIDSTVKVGSEELCKKILERRALFRNRNGNAEGSKQDYNRARNGCLETAGPNLFQVTGR